MPAATPVPVVNQLIANLPGKERDGVLRDCEPVDLVFGETLCEPGQPFAHVYFPLTGFISLVMSLPGHRPLELGMIGFEGMLGITLVLGICSAPLKAMVQGKGSALRISTPLFQRTLQKSPSLLLSLNRYLYFRLTQLSQAVACINFHTVDLRLARWLLMTHDRAQGDHFHLTHQFLADMLGVQRSAVTIAAGDLQRRGLIHYNRGEIYILDRSGLEAASCECYQAST